MAYANVDQLLNTLPNDLPYKASVKRVLMQAPAADVVEVKHGHWVIKKFKNGTKYIICSVCDSVIDSSYTSINEDEFDYCPYCGAKMDEERNLA